MAEGDTPEVRAEDKSGAQAGRLGKVERLGSERIGKLLLEMSAQTTFSLLGGDSALGVFAIVSRLYASIGIPQTGIVQAMQPLVGFNFGQKRFARVKRTITLSLRASVGYGVVVGAICLLIPGILIGMLSHEPTIIVEGQKALRMLALAYPLGGVAVMVAAYFQSLGKAKDALLLTLGGMLPVKPPVLLLGARLFGLNGIWVSETASELLLCTAALLMLRCTQARATWQWSPEQA